MKNLKGLMECNSGGVVLAINLCVMSTTLQTKLNEAVQDSRYEGAEWILVMLEFPLVDGDHVLILEPFNVLTLYI